MHRITSKKYSTLTDKTYFYNMLILALIILSKVHKINKYIFKCLTSLKNKEVRHMSIF